MPVQPVAELHDLVGQVLDLECDLIEHVHDGGKELALVGLRIHVHAFHQALEISDLFRNTHNASPFRSDQTVSC